MKVCRWLGACLALVALSMMLSGEAAGQKKGKKKKTDGEEEATGEKEKAQKGGKKLEWKAFKEGKTFYQEMTTITQQTMKVLTMTVVQQQSQTFYVSWTTEKAEGDTYVVKQKIIGVKMHIEIGGNKIEYDSTAKKDKEPTNPLTDFFKALVDQEFTLKINKSDLKVTEVKGRDEFITKLSKANPQLKPLLEAILSKEALEQMADPVFAAIPPKGEVPKSKTWPRKSELNMGPIGKYTTNYTFTLKDTVKDIATIDVKTDLTYKAPDKSEKTEGLPFRIVEATLKGENPKDKLGTIRFNVKEGRIESSDMEMTLNGDISIEIAGQTTKVNLKQTQKSSLKTMDKNPLESQ
jgi:hypothetical protein